MDTLTPLHYVTLVTLSHTLICCGVWLDTAPSAAVLGVSVLTVLQNSKRSTFASIGRLYPASYKETWIHSHDTLTDILPTRQPIKRPQNAVLVLMC